MGQHGQKTMLQQCSSELTIINHKVNQQRIFARKINLKKAKFKTHWVAEQ